MKRTVLIVLFFCLCTLVACSNNNESVSTVEIQEMLNFEKEKPDTLQTITNSSDVKVIERVFNKARELGEFEDNTIPPQYKVKFGNEEYYLWVDGTQIGTIAKVENKSLFYNVKTTEEFKEIINFKE